MKMITDFGNWLITSGALVTAFIFAWKYVKPVLDEKKNHAATEQSKVMWTLLENIADTAVNSLISSPLTGAQKFDQATKNVQTAMRSQGLAIDQATAETAVQSAYEKSDLTGNSTTVDPVKVAIKDAPNRANQLLVQGKEEQAKG